jgi:aryl-alcohol dehydrogenase-like predicted oxidoreductase
VADKHGVSVANVALRWVMLQGDGRTVHPIVGMRSADHIADNARVGFCQGLGGGRAAAVPAGPAAC